MKVNKVITGLAARLGLILLCLIIPMIVYLAICAWFDVFQFKVFAGDDLRSFEAARRGFTGFNQMMISYYKFRPVTALLFGAVGHWTKGDFHAVASAGLMLHTLNAFLFFYLLYSRIRLPLSPSLGISAVAIFSRFATYVFMQDAALTGGLVIAVFLVILIVSSSFAERPRMGSAFGLVFLYAVIIHTYEQYLVLAVPLLVLGVCTFRLNRNSAVVLSAGVLITALANFGTKTFLLSTPVLIGTETRPLAFNLPQIFLFLWRGALNLAGINAGPAYLSLEDFPDSPWWIQFLSLAAALLSCYLAVGIVADISSSGPGEKRKSALIKLAFYLSTVAAMLLSASITFRQQYIWLYPAYLAFLAFLGFSLQAKKARQWGFQLALTCLLLFSISREIYLGQRHSHFYAFQADQIVNNLYTTLNRISRIGSYDGILIRGQVPAKEWIFLGTAFSRFYRMPSLEFVSQDSPAEQIDESRVLIDYTDADRSFRIAPERQVATVATHRMSIAALQPSAMAFVPSDKWSTPTKTPEFQMAKNGVDCMIEVSPVEVVVPVPPSATVLYICFSHVYAIGDGADLEIAAATETGSTVLLSRRVPPLTDNDTPVWRKYELALPSETRNIDVRVFSKTDSMADWIAIRDFSFDSVQSSSP
jgi:hypothetical protein